MPVDFNNRDEDGAVRLVTRGTRQYLDSKNVLLSSGAHIRMTDGELIAYGTTVDRDGVWVAVIEEWESTE